MTTKKQKTMSEKALAVYSLMNGYPLEPSDFTPGGLLTDEAIERISYEIVTTFPKEALLARGRRILELEVGMFMEELVLIGAMSGTVKKGFNKLRDWTDQEADDAWARAEVRLAETDDLAAQGLWEKV